MSAAPLDQFALWTGLFGGLALFLFGMDLMTGALKRAAGESMKDLLARMTRNRVLGVGMGAVVTGVVNSSSVTTVILVGFISAGVMSMSQSVSIIMGANIGSTFTAQILAFKVTQFALPMITVGFLVSFVARDETRQDYGRMLLGVGLVFYGMGVMSGAMSPLRSWQPFIDFIGTLENPLAAALVGAAFTAVIQSSAATTGIVIVLAGQGLMDLETAIAVALGANVGTCATAGLAAIGKPREAVRAAVVHVLFNVIGVLIWIGFIPELAELARAVSPAAEGLSGAERMAAETPRQIANAHTMFNVVNTLLFLPFTTQFARLVERLVPDRPLAEEEALAPKFLDDNLLSTPAMALQNVRYELGRMGDYVADMLERAFPVAMAGDRAALARITALDRPVDRLQRAILAYLGRVSTASLSPEQAEDLMQLVGVANDLEHVADQIATDMMTSARKRMDERGTIDAETAERLGVIHAEVVRALRDAVRAVTAADADLAADVRAMKREVREVVHEIMQERFRQLPRARAGAVTGYVREIELLEILDAIFKVARRIARSQLRAGETAE